jgi:protein-disulfide isomerase
MRRAAIFIAALFVLGFAPSMWGQSDPVAPAPANEADLLKSSERFMRTLFAWGPDIKVKLGPLAPSPSPEFYSVPVQVTANGQIENGEVFVSKDGKTFLRGEMFSTTGDPFAETRAKIHAGDSPSQGPADAKVVVVEFSDFECPHCRLVFGILKNIEAEFPQVRFVFKDFPLANIHPWAETAAIGAHCAAAQSPKAFFSVQSAIFQNQDLISAENVWEKLVQFANAAGLDAAAYKACLSSDEAKKAVESSRAEGLELGVNSTPTLFINGRSIVGGDQATIEQYIKFELSAHSK